MERFTRAFEEAEVTVTRRQFANICADITSTILQNACETIDDPELLQGIRDLLLLQNAEIMFQLFDLEVED